MVNKYTLRTIIVCLVTAVVAGLFFFTFILPRDTNIPADKESIQDIQSAHTSSGHSLSPLISNQWYSNIFHNFPTYPLYAMPIVYKIMPEGLGFSYPDIKRTKHTIFASYSEDMVVGFSDTFIKPKVTAVGDWTVSADLATEKKDTMSFTIGHGLPYAILNNAAKKDMVITLPRGFTVADGDTKLTKKYASDSFLVTTNGNYYLFSFPQEVEISISNKSITIANAEKTVVSLLTKKEQVPIFKKLTSLEIQDSQVIPKVSPDMLTVVYQLHTTGGKPLMVLYPHQYDNLAGKVDVLATYPTLRGDLKLIEAEDFTMRMPLIVPNGTLTKLTKDYPEIPRQIKKDIADFIKQKHPDSEDYFLGTWFGKGSNLLILADAYGLDDEKEKLLQYIKPLFIKSLDGFFYDKKKTGVIARKPEFGNDELNDHHFHYGYFIRTAAVITSFDLSFLPKVKDKVDILVNDIATIQRASTEYPFLRNFDIYEGHSWADGDGATEDGNNQESTSEAINAWYAVYLWGKVNNDLNIQKYALFLYNIEILSARYYWFDNKNIYKEPYDHAIATIVWGGKVDFATWFSDKTNMKYGIQLLPFTPASEYLGKLSDFKKYVADFRVSKGDEVDEWGELFLMWKSFYAPDATLLLKDKGKKFENNTSRSMFLYTLYNNLQNYQLSITPTPEEKSKN